MVNLYKLPDSLAHPANAILSSMEGQRPLADVANTKAAAARLQLEVTNRLFRGCPPSYSAAYSAGYSAGFRAHSAGTKSQQHAHI